LAKALDPGLYEVHLACHPRYNSLVGDLPFPVWPIRSIETAKFVSALAKGRRPYDARTFYEYVKEDVKLLETIRPDVVVGDYRLSLTISAPITKTPLVALINAYWSPYSRLDYPVPDLPFTRLLGVGLGGFMFHRLLPILSAHYLSPLNQVRREYGLSSLGSDVRTVYTNADHVIYPDIPELVPTFDLPSHHHYLGPILWSPVRKPPAWWADLRRDRPVIYVTLGSSGQNDFLKMVLVALADLPVQVIASSSGYPRPLVIPSNALMDDYLPGLEASARASLVICNGGSPTTQQALVAGTPVLGLPSNLDQYLNMKTIQRAGAGSVLRSGTATSKQIRGEVVRMLTSHDHASAAAKLSRTLMRYNAGARFQDVLEKVFATIN
jgi:UDP:flavonoid glycosyltransferase YjiC (YdhE family)